MIAGSEFLKRTRQASAATARLSGLGGFVNHAKSISHALFVRRSGRKLNCKSG